MNIPTLPTLVAGQVVAAADLNNIASTCTFLLGKPMARAHDITGGLAITTGYSDIPWTTQDFNTDGIWTTSQKIRFTIQTPGWYKVRYSLQISAASTGRTINTKVQAIAGSNNPLGSGASIGSSLDGYVQENASGGTSYCGASGLMPFYLYVGDYVKLRVSADATGAHTGIDSGMPYSNMSIEFVSA